ncbi:20-hydroxyecdysone protein-like [Rhagoletis pomonella]|uniref:20-hydroxyecdysone protein-like n=1 Tax=Rhagoletis pomonella TaxID=28610 RepID=UPI00177A830C|nr:20-hydroxyecdysone protein-like [Rhagoletis pomonella]
MRRTTTGLTPTLVLLILAASAQAGLVHRQNRHANSIAVTAPELGTESLIPVQIITDGLQLDNEKGKIQSEPQQAVKTEELKTSLGTEAVPAPAFAPEVIAEKIAEPTNIVDSLQTVDALQDEQIIKQEITQAIVEENKELLQAAAIAEKGSELPSVGQPQQFLKQAQEINTELKNGVPAAADADAAAAAATYFSAPDLPVAEPNSAEEAIGSDTLKSASLIVDPLPVESQNAIAVQQLVSNEAAAVSISANDESATANQVRQAAAVAAATQATPTQTTTQQNFVQQLIQNSPLGQFFGQLTGQQQQQQLAAQGAQVAADQPATPAPTLPGFLNPQNAITQVQNAAQSVANATAQALQGVQQFATSLGNQFQNTLSSLGGQQQTLSTADSTTPRPPGPIQSLISNFVGGNPQAGGAAAAGSDTPNPAPSQPQGPLQGIITFLQGGNRPQADASASGGAAVVAPVPAGSIIAAAAAPAGASSDSVNKDELTDAAVAEEQAQIDQTDNEVRNSAEVGEDSLEDSNPDQFIIVNDDGSELNQKDDEKVTAVVA